MLEPDDNMFGKAAVILDILTPQQLQEALRHKEEFAKVQLVIPLSQILINKNYVQEHQIEEIRKYAQKLPPQVKRTESVSENIPVQYQKKIGRYFIVSTIGKGAMGEVFKAYDPHLERIIALKLLSSQENTSNIERFQREARTMARLTHSNIVAVYDISNEDNQYFFAMDLIEGCTLDELLQNETLDYDTMVNIILKIASAIDYAHSYGVIHRDLKPANILMEKKQEPKVVDFGLAKVENENQKLSQSGMIIGTLQYMSPEQASGKIRSIDQRSDIYSLGAILYEMITSFPPFSAPTFNQLIKKITKDDPILPRGIRPDVPRELESICLKALNKKPQDRYQTAKDIILDIKAFKNGDTIQASSVQIKKILLYKLKQYNISFSLLIVGIVIFVLLSLSFIFFANSDNKTNLLLAQIEKLSKETTSADDIIQKFAIGDFSGSSLPAQIQIESSLLSLSQMQVLINQVLLFDYNNSNLREKEKYVSAQILKLSLLLNSFLLLDSTNKKKYADELKEWEENNENKIKEQLQKIIAYFENSPNLSEVEINIYANILSKMEPEIITLLLYNDIKDSNKNIRKLAVRILAKLNASSISVNGSTVLNRLKLDLKFFLRKQDFATATEIIFCLASFRNPSIDVEIYKLRESYKQQHPFYQNTKMAYQLIPIDQTQSENLGLRYFAKENFKQSISHLENKELSSTVCEALAISHWKQNNIEQALNYSRKLNSYYNLFNLEIEILLSQNEYQEIEKNESLFKNPWQKEYYLGIIKLKQRKKTITGSPFVSVLNRFPQEANPYYYQGLFWERKKQYIKAIKSFSSFIKLAHNDTRAYFQVGYNALMIQDTYTALWYFNYVLLFDPNYNDIHFYIGKAYYVQQNWAKALFEFTQAIEKNPQNKTCYYLRGKVYLEFTGQPENKKIAINNINKALEIDNTYVDAFFLRGKIWIDEGDYSSALDSLSQAIAHYDHENFEIEVELANIYISRAKIYRHLKKYDFAIKDLKKARSYSNSLEIKTIYKEILKEKKIAESKRG